MLKSRLMRLISARAWGLVVLSAVLQIAIFPIAGPVPQWRAALCWIALTPMLLALCLPDRRGKPLSRKSASLLGYCCGFLWYLGNCYWIEQTMNIYGGMPVPLAFTILILFSLYLGLYHALFAFLFACIRRSQYGTSFALLLTPFLWVTVELARARITGFPWDLLGYAQVDSFALTSLGPIAGVMAMSFVIASVNAAVVFFSGSGQRWKIPAVIAGIAISVQVMSSVNLRLDTPVAHKNTAFMMQENLEVGLVGRSTRPLTLDEELGQFSATSVHPKRLQGSSFGMSGMEVAGNGIWTADNNGNPPTVIIWPEAPSHLQSDDPVFLERLGDLARIAHAPVIAGSLGVDRNSSSSKGYFLYDSASLFAASGAYSGRYDKIHLVPWGEYTPYPAIFGFVHKLTEGIGNMDVGHARTVFTTGGHTYGVFVCYESIFGDEVREFAKNGAEVLVNISDDGWYGDTGAPWQHLNMARMRAIENRRWVLRSTNTGITTAIDPQGRMQAQAPRHVRDAFAFSFEFAEGTTFYTRHGDWFAWLCVMVTLAGLAATLRAPSSSQLHRD